MHLSTTLKNMYVIDIFWSHKYTYYYWSPSWLTVVLMIQAMVHQSLTGKWGRAPHEEIWRWTRAHGPLLWPWIPSSMDRLYTNSNIGNYIEHVLYITDVNADVLSCLYYTSVRPRERDPSFEVLRQVFLIPLKGPKDRGYHSCSDCNILWGHGVRFWALNKLEVLVERRRSCSLF